LFIVGIVLAQKIAFDISNNFQSVGLDVGPEGVIRPCGMFEEVKLIDDECRVDESMLYKII
jgi:hypothetical protein